MAKTDKLQPLSSSISDKKKLKREFSAGGIVFNDDGQVLLIQSEKNSYWVFPKGHIEEGQTGKEAAIREVKEEGGVEAEIVNKAGDSRYIYTLHGERIFKVVVFYLMKYISGDPKDHDWEVKDAKWFGPQEALKTLKFSKDKELLQNALEMLK